MPRLMLTEEHWFKLRPIMLQYGIYDKPNLSIMIEGMLYRMRVGCPWRDLPADFGSWNSIYQKFNRWSSQNKLMELFKALVQEPDLEWEFIVGMFSRKTIRIPGYNYKSNGYYFVTCCIENRLPLFGNIINGKMNVNDAGRMVHVKIANTPHYYPDVHAGGHGGPPLQMLEYRTWSKISKPIRPHATCKAFVIIIGNHFIKGYGKEGIMNTLSAMKMI